jgi:hypothetical protein
MTYSVQLLLYILMILVYEPLYLPAIQAYISAHDSCESCHDSTLRLLIPSILSPHPRPRSHSCTHTQNYGVPLCVEVGGHVFVQVYQLPTQNAAGFFPRSTTSGEECRIGLTYAELTLVVNPGDGHVSVISASGGFTFECKRTDLKAELSWQTRERTKRRGMSDL